MPFVKKEKPVEKIEEETVVSPVVETKVMPVVEEKKEVIVFRDGKPIKVLGKETIQPSLEVVDSYDDLLVFNPLELSKELKEECRQRGWHTCEVSKDKMIPAYKSKGYEILRVDGNSLSATGAPIEDSFAIVMYIPEHIYQKGQQDIVDRVAIQRNAQIKKDI